MNAVVIAFAVFLIVFLVYYSLFYKGLSNRFFGNLSSEKSVILARISGFVLFGIVPLLFTQNYSWLAFDGKNLNILPILILTFLIMLTNFISARRKDNLRIYPQIRTKEWALWLYFISSLTWIIYLVGYEILFRGFLFFALLEEFDLLTAITINTVIYSMAHLQKDIKESLGAIPMGIVLCWLTYKTGNIWTAIWLHSVLALSNEWFSIKYFKEYDVNE